MRVEKAQHRALKLVYNDFGASYSQALSRWNMEYLHVLCLRCIVEVYKISHKFGPMYLHGLFESAENVRQ